MPKIDTLAFNSTASAIMHIDVNSCFATIEQQANPLLRGKPLVVAASDAPYGCVLAASIEAKRLGIKTGMRVKETKQFCPYVIVRTPDPWKYRWVHLALKKLLRGYTYETFPKSIDEFVLKFDGYPVLRELGMQKTAQEIKRKIRKEIGDWLSVSIGIAPNRFLAKTAAGLHKPDGLDEINRDTFIDVYKNLKLTDLCGIKQRNASRLQRCGIYSVLDFYRASLQTLTFAFSSVFGYYWYMRLRGWEIDDFDSRRRTYGNSYVVPRPLFAKEDIAPVLMKLVSKMSSRLRRAGYHTQGLHLALIFNERGFWHKGEKTPTPLFDTRDIYRGIYHLLSESPYHKGVRKVAVSCFNLQKCNYLQEPQGQLTLWGDETKKKSLTRAMDNVNKRWGDYTLVPARMMGTQNYVPDRIAFGGIKELEEFTLRAG